MENFHPTKKLLIDAVLEILDAGKASELTIELVLQHSNISRGSLYYHFQDFDELVEMAQVNRYSSYVDASIGALSQVLRTAKSREEMIRNIRNVTIATQSPQLKTSRSNRVQAIAMASTSDRMQKILEQHQTRLTDAIADLYREVVEKGWGNPNLEPGVVAVMIQAYTLGKVVDDFALEPINPEAWNSLINEILETIIFPG